MSTPANTMSKSDFATLCNVDRSRVSHWIRDKRIQGEALVGSGRSARIVVDVAQRQLRGNLDAYQMMKTGNGANTKLNAKPAVTVEPGPADYVWCHIRGVPSYAALVVMGWGADLRTTYLTYRSLVLSMTGDFERAFGTEPPADFENIDLDFLTEEYKATLGPNDIATWDHEFAHQWDEPPEGDEN